jgi:hypothetical protein
MKKLFALILIVSLLTACGKPMSITTPAGTKEYPTYGLFNESTDKSKNVCYKISIGNVVWSIVLIETIVMPVYFVGFSLYNPIGPKVNGTCPDIDS